MTTQFSKLEFIPLNFSWVALHPDPEGVIFFIGGAFFGTFPTVFYRFFLKKLFERKYTIVALPYRFSLRHWSIATSLVRDQVDLRENMIQEAKRRGYSYNLYKEKPTEKNSNYFWLGHSLGCKYIALLELLTDLGDDGTGSRVRDLTRGDCIPERERRHLRESLADISLKEISLKSQPSILMAPAIEGLEGAIPIFRNGGFSGLKKFLNRIGIKVEPSQKETFCLIEQETQLFNLTSLIYFKDDTRIAAPTVKWLLENISGRLVNKRELKGKHLAPLGWLDGDGEIAMTVIDFLKH
ncbi:MAG: hypothetical protein N5P05_003369 [Chroococcopsis gigantea SAG 12.99]|jgi:hypothetical protein|nr:DUF1350 family protein [Chlorogloea purpurea SAG 13.99]MDV3001763.1 hypothetical protein [Chroococcopsis gigantea SAG 12.99]